MDETTTTQEAPAAPAAPPPSDVWLLLQRAPGMADGEYTVPVGAGLTLHTVEPRRFSPAAAARILARCGEVVREAEPADFERLGLPVPAPASAPPRCSACAAETTDLRNGFCLPCAEFREAPTGRRKAR